MNEALLDAREDLRQVKEASRESEKEVKQVLKDIALDRKYFAREIQKAEVKVAKLSKGAK